MIDGFGWFTKADYLRTWLFFDEVEYVLPRICRPPLAYPREVLASERHRIAHTDLPPSCLDVLVEQTTMDASSAELRDLVASMPGRDRDYAAFVVGSDGELDGVPERLRTSTPWAIAFLANKLIFHAWLTDTVPIMGRRYGQRFLAQKLADPSRKMVRSASFAAGLSLGFIGDDRLAATPFARLADWKRDHRALLERHQKHMLAVAAAYGELAEGPALDAQVAKLRAEALREREQLEVDARLAWQSMGLDVARQAAVAGSTTLLTGLAVVRGTTLADLVGVGLPAVLAGLGSAAAASTESLVKMRRPSKHVMAYLFEVEKLE
jgi:hypothetical protein